jgi:hypothetical protein
VFEKITLGGLDCFCWAVGKSEWRVLMYIVICYKIHRQLCWYIDTVNIVITLLYAVFSNCYHPVGFVKGREF